MSAENDIIPTLDSSVVEVCQRVSASQAACPVSLAKEGFCNYLNSQQPISNIQFAPPSLNNGYWILDTGYWIFSHFPLPLRRAAEDKLIRAKGFMGCVLSACFLLDA